ncbi:hypothetical protein U9M48_010027 [Paspalum notatum var. saurae]|uniref:Reverse transcriptase Ty1/copia-type domain-containing protein n=1 Tax=Paspalum notatum var. saurae TaxID=547442 RepID=A0AAQ3WFP1_PASNO
MGFEQSPHEAAIYRRGNGGNALLVGVYVDDLVITGVKDAKVAAFKEEMKATFQMSDLGPLSFYLGIEVHQDDSGITLRQTAYAKRIVELAGLTDCNPALTPMEERLKLSRDSTAEEVDATQYRRLVGSLRYLVHTRPDLAFSVVYVSRFMQRPTTEHQQAVKRIIRYVAGTLDHGLYYPRCPGEAHLVGYSDSDHDGDIDTSKSTSGILFFLGKCLVSWQSVKQQVVALSSCEAEYIAASTASTQALWLARLLGDLLGRDTDAVELRVDSKSALALAKNPVFHERSKHIRVRYHFIRDCWEEGSIKARYINTKDQLADLLTKPLGRIKFLELRSRTGMRSSADQSLHKRKYSLDPEGALAVEDSTAQSEPLTDDSTQTISNSICSDSTSLDVHVSQAGHDSKENLAATAIQTAFRAFLARRALRALKGIVLLQALIRGHAVRRQTAETLQCMQALVKAQARVRARQVRVALENQAARNRLPEQDDHEYHVREVEGGWCGSIGSMEEMQAKALKRQEAAAKRERAMAYALTHQLLSFNVTKTCFYLGQRQAGSKQQKSTSLQSLELDDNHWGSNWLDRWMAVRPWENRLLDNNAKESMPAHEDKQGEETKSQITPKVKVATSNTPSGTSKKKGVKHKKSYSDVSCTSFARPANVLPSTSLGSSKQKAKITDEGFEEVSSQPTDVASKAVRNPKDKLVQANTPAKKRLSLPNNVGSEAGKGSTRRNSMNRSDLKARADTPDQGKQVELHA